MSPDLVDFLEPGKQLERGSFRKGVGVHGATVAASPRGIKVGMNPAVNDHLLRCEWLLTRQPLSPLGFESMGILGTK